MSQVMQILPRALVADVRQMIVAARQEVARTVDTGLVTLYWHIGQRVRRDILQLKRADYGERIVSALGRQLSTEFGRGFDEKSLRHMIRFAEAFSDETIVSALRRQLTWTHFKALAYVEDDLKRDFYAEMCRIERWNTRTLSEKTLALAKIDPGVLMRSDPPGGRGGEIFFPRRNGSVSEQGFQGGI